MGEGSSEAAALMGPPPAADLLREELALATVQRRVFDSRAPAPVLRRYVLLEALGTGGFGVVLRAYDPELERAVAIKLLRIHSASSTAGVEVLLREARIMAQLSHPNIVTVHDVGRYEEHDLGFVGSQADDLGIPVPGVFLVMELVEQGTLQQQIEQGVAAKTLLDMLLEAGRGLEAAHGLGIVHRDVKPSNILVDDGRVRVADFGLSQPIESGVQDAAGTKAYMAPERLGGFPATVRSDQYAFALTCAVTLWRVPPSQARTLLHASVRAPQGLRRRLRAVLARALSPDPADRYPSMGALLDAMVAATRPHRRRLLVGGALIGATTVAAAFSLAPSQDPCARAGQGLSEAWTPQARDAVASALAQGGSEYASSSSAAVVRGLDAYARRWSDAAGQACADTHIRHVQSEARLDARVDCLARLRLEFSEAVALFTHAEPDLLPRALEVVHGLGWIAACEEPNSKPTDLPEDPVARASHAERSRRLARAKLLELSGRYSEAMALADEVATDRETGDRQRALARLRHGSAAASRGRLELGRASLLESIQIAEAAHADAVVVDGWLRLLWVAGVEMEEAEGETWANFAQAALDRLGDDPRREAELAHGLGGLAYRAQRYDDALTHYQRALRVQRRLLAADDPTLARTYNHIANVLIMLRDFDGAARYIEQSLAIRRRVLGAHHPLVAAALNNLVSVHLGRRDLTEAKATLSESEEILEGLDVPEATVVAELRVLVAEAEQEARADE